MGNKKMKTSETLKRLMIKKGISIPQLSRLTDIRENRIIGFLDGRPVLNLIQQARVINALGYDEEPVRAPSSRRIRPKWFKEVPVKEPSTKEMQPKWFKEL